MNSIKKVMFIMCVVFISFFLMIDLSFGQQATANASGTEPGQGVSSATVSNNAQGTVVSEVKQPIPENKELDRNYWITISYSDGDTQKVFSFVVSKKVFCLEYTFPGTNHSINFKGYLFKTSEKAFAIDMDFSSRKSNHADNQFVYIDKKYEAYASYKLDEELTVFNAGEKDLKLKVLISKNPPKHH